MSLETMRSLDEGEYGGGSLKLVRFPANSIMVADRLLVVDAPSLGEIFSPPPYPSNELAIESHQSLDKLQERVAHFVGNE